MAYSELIKNFQNIRGYMRDFFIYGFKTRDEYVEKSARSYDNERRRIQSYLGELVSFRQTPNGKTMFISLDGRAFTHNPLHRAFKSKSFTSKDITIHFIVMDILHDGNSYTLKNLLDIMDMEYLSCFKEPMEFDESTLRKKMREYVELGIVATEKDGKTMRYRLDDSEFSLEAYRDAIRFFTEEDPLGVVGSYLEDKMEHLRDDFAFKNHYIMNAYDAEILELILQGIHEKRCISVLNFSRKYQDTTYWKVVPLYLYISSQGGRNYLLCRSCKQGAYVPLRVDYIQEVILLDKEPEYENIKAKFDKVREHIWGVSCRNDGRTDHIEMDIHVGEDEEFIVRRLQREKRCGQVNQLNENTYRYTADVYDTYEMVPWIRTFIGRIKRLDCTNLTVVERIREDTREMVKLYGGEK